MVRLFVAFVLLLLASGVHAQERTSITRDNLTQVVTLAKFADTTDVKAIAFSLNEQLIAAGNRAGGVTVWDIESGDVIAQWNDAGGEITGVGWFSDEILIAGSEDGHVHVYDITYELSIDKVPLNARYPERLAVSVNGDFAVTGGQQIAFWQMLDGQLLNIGGINLGADNIVFAGDKLFFNNGQSFFTFDTAHGWQVVARMDSVNPISIFSQGQHVGIIADKLYTGEGFSQSYTYYDYAPDEAAFVDAPDLVAATVGQRLQFVDMATGELLHQIDKATRGTVKVPIIVTSDSSLIAIAHDATVHLFGVQ